MRSGDSILACQFCIGIPGQKRGVLGTFGAWPFLSVNAHLRRTLCTSACQIGSTEERRRSLLFLWRWKIFAPVVFMRPRCSVENICILQVHNIAFNGDGSLARLVTRSLGTIFCTEALLGPLPFVYWSLQLLHTTIYSFHQYFHPLFWYQLTVDVILQFPFLDPLHRVPVPVNRLSRIDRLAIAARLPA